MVLKNSTNGANPCPRELAVSDLGGGLNLLNIYYPLPHCHHPGPLPVTWNRLLGIQSDLTNPDLSLSVLCQKPQMKTFLKMQSEKKSTCKLYYNGQTAFLKVLKQYKKFFHGYVCGKSRKTCTGRPTPNSRWWCLWERGDGYWGWGKGGFSFTCNDLFIWYVCGGVSQSKVDNMLIVG